jgi:hypothetical protein
MILSKLVIAQRQLEMAAHLYVEGADYLAIVALAGAAEEILGNLLRRAGQEAMIDRIVEMDRGLTGGRDFSVVNAEVNRVRNALKHARDPDEDTVTVEPSEAAAMLARALVNYKELAGQLSQTMLLAYQKLAAEVPIDAHQF